MSHVPYERLDASDPADQASDLEQMQLRIALQNQKNSRRVLAPKFAEITDKKAGTSKLACLCHYCDNLLKYIDGVPHVDEDLNNIENFPRFCDEYCRDDWQKEQDMLVRTGKLSGDIRSIPGLGGRTGIE